MITGSLLYVRRPVTANGKHTKSHHSPVAHFNKGVVIALASAAGIFLEASPARLDLCETSLVAGPNDRASPSYMYR